MVKRDLVGRVSTTMGLSALLCKQIIQAGCGVMLRVAGELVGCTLRIVPCGLGITTLRVDCDGLKLAPANCRIYRSTVLQIRAMIGA